MSRSSLLFSVILLQLFVRRLSLLNKKFHTMITIIFGERRTVGRYTMTKKRNGSKKEYVKKGIYHLNNINNYHSRLKKWISRFNGVSTKYLQLYLVWFQFLDNRKMESDLSKKKQMLILCKCSWNMGNRRQVKTERLCILNKKYT